MSEIQKISEQQGDADQKSIAMIDSMSNDNLKQFCDKIDDKINISPFCEELKLKDQSIQIPKTPQEWEKFVIENPKLASEILMNFVQQNKELKSWEEINIQEATKQRDKTIQQLTW